MAGLGPAPKTRRARARDQAPSRVVAAADGEVRGPELPAASEVLPQGEDWHPRTLAWWDTWRRSPQAQEFISTDWDFLLDTALIHSTMWNRNKWEFAAELRLRAGKMGATPEDRLRLRMTVEAPRVPAAGSDASAVTDLVSRRARLSG